MASVLRRGLSKEGWKYITFSIGRFTLCFHPVNQAWVHIMFITTCRFQPSAPPRAEASSPTSRQEYTDDMFGRASVPVDTPHDLRIDAGHTGILDHPETAEALRAQLDAFGPAAHHRR